MKMDVTRLAQQCAGWQRRLLLVIFASALVLPFALGPTMTPAAEAASSWVGINKGVVWAGGDWHHYVEFNVSACMRSDSWRVSGPRNPEFWGSPGNCVGTVRAYYSWPYNLPDTWPASAWRLTNG